jgi:hypothetical protein
MAKATGVMQSGEVVTKKVCGKIVELLGEATRHFVLLTTVETRAATMFHDCAKRRYILGMKTVRNVKHTRYAHYS